jgi:RNA polymerase sigma-70 factor (ECF subfamily)
LRAGDSLEQDLIKGRDMTGMDTLTLASAQPLTDDEVVARVRAGETPLFEILMRRHNQRVYRAARAIVKDESEAEDVMQAAYVNAYAHLDQFAGRAQFGTWLMRIAVHEGLARIRRSARLSPFDEDEEMAEDPMERPWSIGGDPERQASNGELRVLLEAAVAALPVAYRLVFVFREVEGLSTAETASCLEISEDAVKTRLHRARALLRDELFARAGIETAHAFEFHLSRCDRLVAAVMATLGASGPASPRP